MKACHDAGKRQFPVGVTNITKIMFFGFIYFVLLNYLTFAERKNDVDGELSFVSFLYRHGDRAPLGTYPNDPHKNETCWPNGWGELTKLGKFQQYELGQWIRHHYWDFIPLKYSSKDIYVQSTDVDRTLVSAYWNLAGLYECWNQKNAAEFNCQTIPVHTMPLAMDGVLATHKPCPKYDELLKEFTLSEEVCSVNDYYSQSFANLSEHTGLNIKSLEDVPPLYSILHIQNMHGMKLPNWTGKFYPQPLQEMVEFVFKIPCFTPKLQRLKCGPLLKDIIEHMEAKIEGKMTQRVWMYSAHDSTVANLLMCLNVYDGVLPQYTAMVVLELYKKNKEYYVVISYKTPTTFRNLRLPFCDRVCPFRDFKKIVRPVIPENWDSECVVTN